MFGPIGGPELVLILALALLLFGPRKLPQIGKTLGKAMAEFRGATQEFRASLEREVELDEIRETRDTLTQTRDEIGDSVRELTRGTPRPRKASADSPEAPPPAADTEPESTGGAAPDDSRKPIDGGSSG